MNVFISGSIGIIKLPKKAIEKIDNIIKKEYKILVGDAKGVDLYVQKYLFKKKYKNAVVYYAGNKIRNNVGQWETKNIVNHVAKGKKLYTLKDTEMANDADYGLMIWDGKSDGTMNNISMMKLQNKGFFVVIGEMLVDDKNIESILKIHNIQNKNTNIQTELF